MTSPTRCQQQQGNNLHRRPSPHIWKTTSRLTLRKPWTTCSWADLGTIDRKTSGYQNPYIAVLVKRNTETPTVKKTAKEATMDTTLTTTTTVRITDLLNHVLLNPDHRNGMITLTEDSGSRNSRMATVMTLKAPQAATQHHTGNPDISQGSGTSRRKQRTALATSGRNKRDR